MPELHVTAWAHFYRSCGWNPLPSRADRKGPALPEYAAYRDGVMGPESWLEDWPAPNIQIPLGVAWRLLVVDVDGPRALAVWHDWHMRGRCWPETWTVRSRRGKHFYYRIPEGVAKCPSRPIWLEVKNRMPVKHSEIRVLADQALIVAPPSRHVDPPHPVYAFLEGRQPGQIPLAIAPQWLLDCPEFKVHPRPRKVRRRLPLGPHPETIGVYASVEAVPPLHKLWLAKSWGLRIAREVPNSRGWVSCHALDREDEHPSASLHVESGVFWQAGSPALSFPELAVALGAACDVREARAMMGVADGTEAAKASYGSGRREERGRQARSGMP